MEREIEEIFRRESRRIFATLVRLLGDFDAAEEALQDAFVAALKQWPVEGIPAQPRSWLISAGRFKGVDAQRRQSRREVLLQEVSRQQRPAEETWEELEQVDDRLRLIFTCCHPALSPDAQIALTLREVCGLTTEEVASAFLTSPPTVAQRIVRAKAKIRGASIPYIIPALDELPGRLDAVLSVIYLVFNEGYSASSGNSLTRHDLTQEAIRLGRLVVELMPDPEAIGLLALMLLHESRRTARATPEGDLILLENQDRSLWDLSLIEEGRRLVEQSLRTRRFGSYTLQAAIASIHAQASSAGETDWRQIVALYDALLSLIPSPVIALNRAVAVGMNDGPAAGIELIEQILSEGSLKDYHLAHAAQADFLRRLDRKSEAAAAYQRALDRALQEPERRFLRKRIQEMES